MAVCPPRQLVKPTDRPKLTAFCTELTSITQAQVDAARPLCDVIALFKEWLPATLGTDDTSGVLPITCGEPDLAQMLPRECARKGLQPPPVLKRYCNIKKPFQDLHGWKGGMSAMLQGLKLPLVGHHHLGIDDARNIAQIAARLAELGAEIDVTGCAEARQRR